VSIAKPISSRSTSIESFVVCQGFKGGSLFDLPLEKGLIESGTNAIMPYLSHGDLNQYQPPNIS